MLIFPFTLLAVGLIFLAISKKLSNDVERLDANYTGNLIPDVEEKLWYDFDKKKKIRNSKGARYFGYFLIFWSIMFSIAMIVGEIN
jgi:hypothetical protein